MDIEQYKESMPRCKDCTGFGWGECKTAGENEVACKDFERKPKLTNADRIRQMTDEELAEWFAPHMGCNICDKNDMYDCDLNECKKYALAYMKKELTGDAGTD